MQEEDAANVGRTLSAQAPYFEEKMGLGKLHYGDYK